MPDPMFLPTYIVDQDVQMLFAAHLAGTPVRLARGAWDAPKLEDFNAAITSHPIRVPSQFDPSLSPAEAYAACGPAAAVAFAQMAGRYPTIREAVDIAKTVGWTTANGMAGPASEQALLHKLGVSASLENNVDWTKIQREVATGNPVIIDTPQHYFVATAYDPTTGKFNFSNSGTALKAGSEWMTPEEVARLSPPRATLYLDSPHAILSSPAAGPSPLGSSIAYSNKPLQDVGYYTWNDPSHMAPTGTMPGGSKTGVADWDTHLDQSTARMELMYRAMSGAQSTAPSAPPVQVGSNLQPGEVVGN